MSSHQISNWRFSQESAFRYIAIGGADAEEFLQGQLTQDVKSLKPLQAAWTASCNYQGRVASSGLLLRLKDGFGLVLPSSIADEEVARLKKYVLRSKVTLEVSSEPIGLFSASDAAAARLGCPALPQEVFEVHEGASVVIVRLPSKEHAYFLTIGELPATLAPTISPALLAQALMTEGVCLIEKSEVLEWLPQALNLDLIGAVSLRKGCYSGQEIISKTTRLGKVKRRLYLGRTEGLKNLDAGVEVFAGAEPVGRVIQSSGDLFSFVLRAEFAQSALTVKNQAVVLVPLPYEVTLPESVI